MTSRLGPPGLVGGERLWLGPRDRKVAGVLAWGWVRWHLTPSWVCPGHPGNAEIPQHRRQPHSWVPAIKLHTAPCVLPVVLQRGEQRVSRYEAGGGTGWGSAATGNLVGADLAETCSASAVP